MTLRSFIFLQFGMLFIGWQMKRHKHVSKYYLSIKTREALSQNQYECLLT